jgi:predicted nucleotidyltransferase
MHAGTQNGCCEPRTRARHSAPPSRRHRADISARFGARELGLFGSAARDELRTDSDVDILVEFDASPTFDGYFGLKDYLQGILGRPVDLVTRRGLKPRAVASIDEELIRVA